MAAISKHVKYEKAISTTQHGFAKGMLSVANLTAPCVKMPGILSAMEAFVTEKKNVKKPQLFVIRFATVKKRKHFLISTVFRETCLPMDKCLEAIVPSAIRQLSS